MRAALLVVALAACDAASADPGLDALVRVDGASFHPGPMPAATTTIAVTAVDSLNNQVWGGQVNKGLTGRIAHGARAVAIGLPDDVGYWIVPAGAADLDQPDELTWSAKLSFADVLESGPHDLEFAAVDRHGGFGPSRPLGLTVLSRQLDLAGTKLAFALRWDSEADLDLHVVVPGDPPVIVWSGNLNTYVPPAPGDPVDPDAAALGGILDFDSNASCLIDGRREENVVWRGDAARPPHGTYQVLVDTFSLCAAATAHWDVDVFRDGDATAVAHAEGTVADGDTRGDHLATSGLRALTFHY